MFQPDNIMYMHADKEISSPDNQQTNLCSLAPAVHNARRQQEISPLEGSRSPLASTCPYDSQMPIRSSFSSACRRSQRSIALQADVGSALRLSANPDDHHAHSSRALRVRPGPGSLLRWLNVKPREQPVHKERTSECVFQAFLWHVAWLCQRSVWNAKGLQKAFSETGDRALSRRLPRDS
jgi:hypothetical protein